jgi:hypothetical protein
MSYRSLDGAEASLLQDFLPDQAYFTFTTVSISYFFWEGWKVPDLISKGQEVVVYP